MQVVAADRAAGGRQLMESQVSLNRPEHRTSEEEHDGDDQRPRRRRPAGRTRRLSRRPRRPTPDDALDINMRCLLRSVLGVDAGTRTRPGSWSTHRAVSQTRWVSRSSAGRCRSRRLDGAAGVVEGALDDAAEHEHDGDDQRGDAGDQQAVLHGGGAVLVATTRLVMVRMNSSMMGSFPLELGGFDDWAEPNRPAKRSMAKMDRLGHRTSGLNHCDLFGWFRDIVRSDYARIPNRRTRGRARARRGVRRSGGGVAEEIRPSRIAVTSAWARLAAPSFS